MPYICWSAKAQDAMSRGDWVEAKRCWYYAAQECRDGDMRAYYNRCEDAAGDQVRAGMEAQRKYDEANP